MDAGRTANAVAAESDSGLFGAIDGTGSTRDLDGDAVPVREPRPDAPAPRCARASADRTFGAVAPEARSLSEPAEPPVSAQAAGEKIAAPTPNINARAPTRPMYRP